MLTLFLCGEVMTGRGIDQILPHPGPPQLHEPHVTAAQRYVEFAERANGPVAGPVDFPYIWGEALAELDRECRAFGARVEAADRGGFALRWPNS